MPSDAVSLLPLDFKVQCLCLAPNFLLPVNRDPYEIEKEMMEGIVASGEL